MANNWRMVTSRYSLTLLGTTFAAIITRFVAMGMFDLG
jgi:hypothetical protein